MGFKRNIQDFLDFLVALFSSKNVFAFELYKKTTDNTDKYHFKNKQYMFIDSNPSSSKPRPLEVNG